MLRKSLLISLGWVLACGLPGSPPPPPLPPPPPPEMLAEAPEVAPAAALPGEIPYYYKREITAADLQNRSLKELTLIRNTIYARAGNPFRKSWLNEYFRSQSWYLPAGAVDTTKLSALDYKNAAFVADYEAKISRQELEQRRDQLLILRKQGQGDPVELVLLARALGENAWNYDAPAETVMEVTPIDDPRMLDKLLRVDQLRDLSRRDLRILRNTVYARHGRPFKSELLQLYFERQSWYKENPAFSESMLSEIDKRNVQIIRSLEDSLGGPLTDYQHKSEEGWFVAA